MGPSKTKDLSVPALKYIKQVRYEIGLGRGLQKEIDAKETSWGNLCEKWAFRNLPLSYQYVANQGRLFHPTLKHYSGIPDFLNGTDAVCDSKCPFSLEKFCDKIAALDAGYTTFKEEFPADFWQLISNAALLRANGVSIKFMEAINYVPYESELENIRAIGDGDDSVRWFSWTSNAGLPWLHDGGKYKNMNIHRFEIQQQDVNDLVFRINECVKKLYENKES
jgi:hypothetical protein